MEARNPRKTSGGLLTGAIITAICAIGVFGPLLGLKTDQNIDNRLVLNVRPVPALVAVAITVGIFFAVVFYRRWREEHAHKTPAVAAPPSALRQAISRWVAPGGMTFLFLYPMLILLIVGTSGVPKWVDNFGILILIYVMLGWGLNIVVGLAGLLDLGYVAFYAIGSYSYALLSFHFGWSFWVCLPVAGILAAFWGVLLGFPVLRLRGDYLAIVTLAFGEIIYLVAKNWKDFTGGGAGVSAPRITFFGVRFEAGKNGFAARMSSWLTDISQFFGGP